MLLTPHVVVGAAISYKTGNIYLGGLAAFASHFVFDAIPHFDKGTLHGGKSDKSRSLDAVDYSMIAVDAPLLLITFFLFLKYFGWNWLVIAGMFFSALPDLLDNVPWWRFQTRKLFFWRPFYYLHSAYHLAVPKKIWYIGFIAQALFIALAIWWLL